LINELAEGEEILNMAKARGFLDPLIEARPSPALLRDLRQIVNSMIFEHADEKARQESRDQILDYCMDIAAAAVTQYPYNKRDRFVAEEKELLRELFEGLG